MAINESEETKKLREQLHDTLYWEMCRNCPRAKHCHEECEECDEFMDAFDKQCKKHNCEEPTMTNEEWDKYFKEHYIVINKESEVD